MLVAFPFRCCLRRGWKSSYLVWNHRGWAFHEHLINDHSIDGVAVYFKCGAYGLCEQNNLQLSLIRADLHCNHYLFVQSCRHYARSSIIRRGILITVSRCRLTSHHPLRVLRTKYLPFYKYGIDNSLEKGFASSGSHYEQFTAQLQILSRSMVIILDGWMMDKSFLSPMSRCRPLRLDLLCSWLEVLRCG